MFDLCVLSDHFQSVCGYLALSAYMCLRDLLEDNGLWPDKCLQDLSRKLGLQASGIRDELITRLRLWHVSKHHGKGFQGKRVFLFVYVCQ